MQGARKNLQNSWGVTPSSVDFHARVSANRFNTNAEVNRHFYKKTADRSGSAGNAGTEEKIRRLHNLPSVAYFASS